MSHHTYIYLLNFLSLYTFAFVVLCQIQSMQNILVSNLVANNITLSMGLVYVNIVKDQIRGNIFSQKINEILETQKIVCGLKNQ